MYLSYVLFLIYKLCMCVGLLHYISSRFVLTVLDSDLYLHANSGAVVIDRTAVLGVIQ